jgi:hypothetical protein
MVWYEYIAYFFGGLFLANGIPHFISGITGRMFPTPFAKPPGIGKSKPVVNVLWGLANLVGGYLLIVLVGEFNIGFTLDALIVGLGILWASVGLSWFFAGRSG